MIDPTIANQMHGVIRMLAREIANEFDKNNFGYVRLNISITGRTREELALKYSLSKCQYGSNAVEGGHVERVLEEVIRREYWQEQNASLKLPKPFETDDEDESN